MNSGEMLEPLARLARQASGMVMAVYATDFSVCGKDDASPVTAADERAEAVILVGLATLAPEISVVAEESVAAGRTPDVSGGRLWLVEPPDGTREFVNCNGEFTVNIALIDQGAPVLGVVLAPAVGGPAGRLITCAVGQGAWVDDAQGRRPIRCRGVPAEGLTVLASRSHGDTVALDAFLAGRRVARLANAGSSLKLCLLAEGAADLYPRHGRTMEWNIAAGHAVLAAAGGQVWQIDGSAPLAYVRPGFENPHFYAVGLAG